MKLAEVWLVSAGVEVLSVVIGSGENTAVYTVDVEPAALLAVSATRSVEPRSAVVVSYVVAVWPLMSVQLLPSGAQRCHCSVTLTLLPK